MKNNILFASVCSVLMLTIQAQATVLTSIPGVFSTGVDNAGVSLSIGTVDSHYQITSSPLGAGPALTTVSDLFGAGGTATSSWINGSGTTADALEGDYTYVLTFSLAGFDPATASISGLWTSDNTSAIYLNGNDTGFAMTNPWGHLVLDNIFTINSGFVAGDNVLSFLVHNDAGVGGNPTGLQVQIQSAVAVAAVPEPTTWALCSGLGLLALVRRNRAAKA